MLTLTHGGWIVASVTYQFCSAIVTWGICRSNVDLSTVCTHLHRHGSFKMCLFWIGAILAAVPQRHSSLVCGCRGPHHICR